MDLTQDKKKIIVDKVEEILRTHNVFPYSFDPLSFINRVYGFTIESRKFLDEEVTGTLLVDDDKPIFGNVNRLISINSTVVNGKDGFERTCFITLHEFAHFILHKKEHRQFAMRDTREKETEQEKEADYFALCMIMPEKAVKKSITNIDDKEEKIDTVRRVFHVTEKKAIMRLEDLKLIS